MSKRTRDFSDILEIPDSEESDDSTGEQCNHGASPPSSSPSRPLGFDCGPKTQQTYFKKDIDPSSSSTAWSNLVGTSSSPGQAKSALSSGTSVLAQRIGLGTQASSTHRTGLFLPPTIAGGSLGRPNHPHALTNALGTSSSTSGRGKAPVSGSLGSSNHPQALVTATGTSSSTSGRGKAPITGHPAPSTGLSAYGSHPATTGKWQLGNIASQLPSNRFSPYPALARPAAQPSGSLHQQDDGDDIESDVASQYSVRPTSPLGTPPPIVDEEDFAGKVDAGASGKFKSIDHSKYTELASRIKDDGWLPMILEAWDDEYSTGTAYILNMSLETWINLSDEVLSAMNPKALSEMCTGNLALAYRHDPDLKKDLDRYKVQGEKQPSLYIRMLCNTVTCEPMEVSEAETLIHHARRYAVAEPGHAEDAYKIDAKFDKGHKWHKSYNQAGQRWYLRTGNGKDGSQQRVNVLLTFAQALEDIVEECKRKNQHLMPFMHYIGYAINSSVRQHQHETFSSTNWLCMFVQAVVRLLWNNKYTMKTFTVCLLTEEHGGAIGEMLLTRLTRSYYFAGGFCIDQAGKSMQSIHMTKLTDAERTATWKSHAEWVRKHTVYNQNHHEELERRKGVSYRNLLNQIAKDEEDIAAAQEEGDSIEAPIEPDAATIHELGDEFADIFEIFDKDAEHRDAIKKAFK